MKIGAQTRSSPFRNATSGHRFYNASTGRWLNRDPIAESGGNNLFVYAQNDLINYSDFLGLINIIRLGFRGAGKTEGNWLRGLGQGQKFDSRDKGKALQYIVKQLDTDADGKVTDCDEEADIRITGYSWGGWTAVQLAKDIDNTNKIESKGDLHRRVMLGLLDPVDTARIGSGQLSPNVVFALDIFQQNGCYKNRCPGPSSWYKGTPIVGAVNVDVTNSRISQNDGVPLNMTPDHVHMMLDYLGVASAVGNVLWLAPQANSQNPYE